MFLIKFNQAKRIEQYEEKEYFNKFTICKFND